MKVSAVMSTQVVTVSPEATLREAIAVMLRNSVGSVVVVETGPVGIITRSDVLRAVYHEEGTLSDLTVVAGMSTDLITVEPSASISKALRTMETHDIKKLPVVADLELVGIITMTDIAQNQPERVREARGNIERRDDWTD